MSGVGRLGHRVLVTGSAGLIGKALVEELRSQGMQVDCLDIRAEGQAKGDVCDPGCVQRAMAGVDGVVHLAAVSRVVWGEQDPESCWATNVEGTKHVAEVVARSPRAPWLLFASSREVYGQPAALPVSEDAPLRPMNVYGRSKVEGERVVAEACRRGVRACIVRLSNVYGSPDDHATRVIPAFIRAALAGDELRVEGAEHTFDFTHVDDVKKALARLVELLRGVAPVPPPIHLVSGRPVTLGWLAELAVSMGRHGARVNVVPPRDFDVSCFHGDPARAKATLGWQPRISLEEGVAQLFAAFKERQQGHGPVS